MSFPTGSRLLHRRRPLLAGAGALAVAGTFLAAAATPASADAAHAPSASRFAMHEIIDHTIESYTFTADGPLCPSGSFVDHVNVTSWNADHTVVHWRVSTTYTCDDGSGTFTAVKKLVRHQDPTGRWDIGAVRFTGGTGAFAALSGRGHDVGAGSNAHATGTIAGRALLDAS